MKPLPIAMHTTLFQCCFSFMIIHPLRWTRWPIDQKDDWRTHLSLSQNASVRKVWEICVH